MSTPPRPRSSSIGSPSRGRSWSSTTRRTTSGPRSCKWNQTIERLHASCGTHAGRAGGVVSQLDFSATPKDQKGQVFRHVVVDYPLAQAVDDGIVKTPLIGEVTGATVELGDSVVAALPAVARRRGRALAQVRRGASPSGKRPVLFVMCENTQAADEAGDYLRQRPDFAGDRLLVIHTNRSGEITKADLDIARKAAREIDGPDSDDPLHRQRADAPRGLGRPQCLRDRHASRLTAKAKILPEQALGRGLRRMTPPGSGFDERVVVIEHDAFRDLWSAELDGGLVVEREDADKIEPGAVTIFADEGKRRYDIVDPAAHAHARARETALDQLDPDDVDDPETRLEVPDVAPDEYIKYRGMHLIDKVVIEEYEFLVPYAEDPSGVITWYTKSVAKAGGVERSPARSRPLHRWCATTSRTRLRPTRRPRGQGCPAPAGRERRAADRDRRLPEGDPGSLDHGARADDRGERLRVSDTPPFPWSRDTVEAERTVFNLTPVDNSFERRFAEFLDRAADVAAFAKLTLNSRFALEYISTTGALRYYYPDFVVRLDDDTAS